MSQPSTVARPKVGTTRPRIMAMVVVLPAPLPPSRPTVHPFGTVKFTSSTAQCARYLLHRSSTAMAGASSAPVRGGGLLGARAAPGVTRLSATNRSIHIIGDPPLLLAHGEQAAPMARAIQQGNESCEAKT